MRGTVWIQQPTLAAASRPRESATAYAIWPAGPLAIAQARGMGAVRLPSMPGGAIMIRVDHDAPERIADGEQRRDVGIALAAARRPDRVTLGRLAMLRAMLSTADGIATIDDATTPDELSHGYADGGRWRGSVTRSLVVDGYAEIVGTTRSTRPSRHRGYIARLRLVDRPAAIAHIASMAAALSLIIGGGIADSPIC